MNKLELQGLSISKSQNKLFHKKKQVAQVHTAYICLYIYFICI